MTRKPPPAPRRVLIAAAENCDLSAVRWLLAAEDRRVILEGRRSEGAGSPPLPEADRTVLITPGQAILARRLALGAARPAQARAAALHQLAGERAETQARLTGGVGAPDADGRRLAAVVDEDMMERWLARAAALGFTPDVILPDSLVPPRPEGEGWSALNLFERVAAHGRDAAFTAEPDLAAAVMDGTPVVTLESPEQIERALTTAAFDPPLNLMDGRAGAGADTGWRPWRRAMVLATALALLPLVTIAAEAVRFEIIAGALERRSREAVRAAWPDAPTDAAPAAEARRRLGPVATGGFGAMAAALFAAVETVEGAELETLVLDEGGEMRTAIAHRDYADLARLDAALAEHGLELREDSVLEENGRMISDVTAAPR